jgi:hypothetical protein
MQLSSCQTKGEAYYSGTDDFEAMPKVDAHYHYDNSEKRKFAYLTLFIDHRTV